MSIKKNTYWNIFGSVAPMLVGLISIPILLENLGTEKLGILTLVWALIGYFSIFDFGLGRALTQRVSLLRSKNNSDDISLTSKYGMILMLIIGSIGAALCQLLLSNFSLAFLNFSEEAYIDSKAAIQLAILAIPITTVTSGFKGILEGFEDFKATSLLRALLGLLNFSTPILSLFLYGPSLEKIVFFLVISRLIILIFHGYLALPRVNIFLKPKQSPKKYIADIFYFGSWLTVSNIISPLMVNSDRFVISIILGASIVAYYSIPAEFLIKFLIIPAALTTTLFPRFSQLIAIDRNKAILIFYKSIRIIFIFSFPLMLVISILAFYGLSLWLGEEFANNSYIVVIILSIGILFNSIAQVPHAFLQANGNVKLTSIVHVFEFILYLPMLIVFINTFGIIGAAISWTLRAFFDFLILYFFSKKLIIN